MKKGELSVLGLLVVGAGLLFASYTGAFKAKSTSVSDFASRTVMVVNLDKNSGGSGSIISSSPSGSLILTNKHVCKVIEKGGYVQNRGEYYLIDSYKKYPSHDLCLISVIYDFKVNTPIAASRPEPYSSAYVSGHPGLMPNVVTSGVFSERDEVRLVVGLKDCDDKTPPEYTFYCMFFGAMPVIEAFNSQLVTAQIMPGSSGSAVYNSKGEISGVVFAGRGRGLTYAYIVPHEYIVNFLKTQASIPFVKAGDGTDYKDLLNSVFTLDLACIRGNTKLKNLCNYVGSDLLYR